MFDETFLPNLLSFKSKEYNYVNDGNYGGGHKTKIAQLWFSLDGRYFSLLILQTSEFDVANCMVGISTSRNSFKL